MFKAKKPVAKHDDIKMAGATTEQAPIDLKKIVSKSTPKKANNGRKKG
jgi:hypothetical protein